VLVIVLTFAYRRCKLKRLINFSYLFIPTRICLRDADRIIFHISTVPMEICHFLRWRYGLTRAMASTFLTFLDHTQ
jgi:hypothetical protein